MSNRGVAFSMIAGILLLTGVSTASAQEITLYNFKGSNSSDGSVPVSNMIFDSAGNLYGTTSSGGAVGYPYDTNGTVFELSPAGGGAWTEKVLYNFGTNAGDGTVSEGGLVFDAQGNLYGTTVFGGANGNGSVYELSPGAGGIWTEKVIYSFGPTGLDGASPKRGSLIFDTKGNLYGTTFLGGPNTVNNGAGVQTAGTVFELSPGTGGVWTEKIIHNFGAPGDGANSVAGLVMDAAGNLYGTTVYGGSDNSGTAFEMSPGAGGTWTESVIHNFSLNGTDGTLPQAGLTFDTQGNLYGTAYGGGSNPYYGGLGAVFELSPAGGGNWSEGVIYSFDAVPGIGDYPFDSVTLDSAGNLYCTASSGLYAFGQVLRLTPGPNGWTETTLYYFGDTPDGWDPYGGVVFDTQGNLYGTTSTGGAESADFGLGGTVYEIPNLVTPNPTFSPASGSYSGTKMVTISDTIVGTTIYYSINGGAYSKYSAEIEVSESETIEAIAIAGTLPQSQTVTADYQIGTTTATPEFWPPEGTYSEAQSVTIMDAAPGATIYYTTNGVPPTTSSTKYTGPITVSSTETIEAIAVASGYANSPVASGIYTITPPIIPQEGVLYSFVSTPGDGDDPVGGLTWDAQGNLYGVDYSYGGNNVGTVFKLVPGAGGTWSESVIYTFGTNANDGNHPEGPLVFDSKGNLYGTTYSGGTLDDGTVFELTPTKSGPWTETILYNFGYITNDGINPEAGLIIDSAGNLYGTTNGGGAYSSGGANPGGTVFELSPNGTSNWTETILHSFDYLNTSDGYYPQAPVVFDSKGNLYGTTTDGGSAQDSQGGGTVFELSPNGTTTWKETILRSFGGCTEFCSDGYLPLGGVVLDAVGNVYGTTSAGGPNGFGADGIVFELSPGSGGTWTEKVIHNFGSNETDGTTPKGGLVFDGTGNLYGTTFSGGTANQGTVFELTPETVGPWREIVLHSFLGYLFDGSDSDGSGPSGVLIRDSANNLYGETTGGGAIDFGTVFEVGAVSTASPRFSPPAGTYTAAQMVAITAPTPDSTIYYTTNGDTPTSSSTKYTAKISVTSSETIKAIAIATGLPSSSIATAAYQLAIPAVLTSPTSGSILAGSDVTFTWSAGSGITNYELYVGTTGAGSNNLYNSGEITTTSDTVSGIPTNGEAIYVRLYSKTSGLSQYYDYTFTAAELATLTSPTPGSTLAGPSVTFTWTSIPGNTGYWLFLGTTGVGSKDLLDSGETAATSVTFSALPTNGTTIYARVYTRYNGNLVYNDYTYKAAAQAVLTAPTPSSTFTSSSATFDWTAATGSGNQGYWLFLGTTGVGSKNLYDSGQQTATSATFNNLPTDGATIYARLYTRYNGTLVYYDYTYAALMQPPTLTSPMPSSTLAGPSVTFTWTPEAGSQGYWLFLGTTGVGSKNLYDSGQQTATSATVSNLPTNGATIYARVYTRYNGTLVYNDYIYKAQ